ncbi:TerC family protein [Calditerricola satsumensis]|uniref:TerC family protein n=1 Tax=Calditerricola satsumensis TaxID=373054 RepID=A0A8J3F9E5_9BACI|nr:TerC family protein [Calditerricola satsumensis]GGJ93409.1 hypothetical protein GCM10007043_03920 [Calditerricola satsumensis]
MSFLFDATWWADLFKIILIDLILAGDNAVVIALAVRGLPPRQRKMAIIWGTAGAVIFRGLLTLVAVWLLKIPFLQLVGGVLLMWIAVKLMKDEEEKPQEHAESLSFWAAMRTIIIADVIMSLDNVLAIAGVSKGDWVLIFIGLAVSIPLVIYGSKLLSGLMKRYPIIITLGAAILGWTAGEMMAHDLERLVTLTFDWLLPIAGALVVVAWGYLAKRRKAALGTHSD